MLVSQRTVSAEAHQSTIETVRQVTDLEGHTVLVTNRYVELATGLNRTADTGQWLRASDLVEEFDQGFVARQSAHQVLWPRTLDAAAVIDVRDAEGHRYRSRVLGLSWFDAASGKSELIAETHSAEGKLGATNTVLYEDAFDGIEADLAYVNRRGGLSQEVILREALPGPELWGLAPDSSRLEVITEFVEAPAFTERERVLRSVAPESERAEWAAPDLVDAEVVFGAYRLGPGRAFALGEEDDLGAGTGVAKCWEELDGRRVLFEQVEWRQVKDEIGRLPRQARADGQDNLIPRTGSVTRQLPARPVAVAVDFNRDDHPLRSSKPLLAADLVREASGPGYVLDYELVTSQEDLTFKGDTTYYVTGSVTLTGTTTLEGGAVVKFAPGSPGKLLVRGPFVDDTALYRPAIFTARDDDTVGAVISGSNGDVNSQPYYGLYHLYFQTASPVDLRHVRIKHACYGLLFNGYYGEATHLVRHAQLIDCMRPMLAVGTTSKLITLKAQNVLIAEVKAGGGAFTGNAYSTVEGQHLTVANAPNLYAGFLPANFTLWNSLLVDVGTIPDYVNRSEPHNVETSGAVFQTKGGGGYYLAESSSYRDPDNGSPEIESSLLSDLKTMTTCPPEEAGSAITTGTTWYTRPIRDLSKPDFGYHYPALDYLVHDLAIQNATLTLTRGVAVGVSSSETSPNGFVLESGGRLVGQGGSLPLNRLVHQATAQEESIGNTYLITEGTSTGAPREVNLRLTELSMPAPANGGNYTFWGGSLTDSLTLRDCEVYGGCLWFRQAGTNPRKVTLQNNVFARSYVSLGDGSDTLVSADGYNNLFWHNNAVNLNAASGTASQWQWHDNLFHEAAVYQYYGDVTASHNACVRVQPIGGTWPLRTTTGPVLDEITTLDYMKDAWGRGWYPDTDLLAAAGSRSAAAAGLSDYTTGLDQNMEGNATVSIGYHRLTEAPRRLAHWRFEGDAQNWLVSEEGVAPVPNGANGLEQVTSFTGAGTALQINDSGDYLMYPETQPGGYLPNLNLQRGSIRLWFKPNWTLSNVEDETTLLEVGDSTLERWRIRFGNQNGERTLYLSSRGAAVEDESHHLEMRVDPNQCPGKAQYLPKWDQAEPAWLRLSVSWDEPTLWAVVKAQADDGVWYNSLNWYTPGDPPNPCKTGSGYYGGNGIPADTLPSPTVRADGFSLGGDTSGLHPAKGSIDEVETFNYPIGAVEHLWRQNACKAEVSTSPSPRITLRRPEEPSPVADYSFYYWRRTFGQNDWQCITPAPTDARVIEDDNVNVNVLYEYGRSEEENVPPFEGDVFLAASIEREAVHERGKVILLVDPTFLQEDANSLSPEIGQLREDLVGDGWKVTRPITSSLPANWRHEDIAFAYDSEVGYGARNLASRDAIAGEIEAEFDPNAARNVVLILGHVTIPYSGMGGYDNHYSTHPDCVPFGDADDHGGPWVADAWYGVRQKSLWSDHAEDLPPDPPCDLRWHRSGDELFDDDAIPLIDAGQGITALDMAVGRIDFAYLRVFEDADFLPPGLQGVALEAELLRGYLRKDHRYRMAMLPFGRRVCSPNGLEGAARLASSCWGLDYGTLFNGRPYLQNVPCAWGFYASSGGYERHYLGGETWFEASWLSSLANEPPVLFYNLKGPWFCDWNIRSTGGAPNNFLRSLLGTPNYGLACFTWDEWNWRWHLLGVGSPLADVMRYGLRLALKQASKFR